MSPIKLKVAVVLTLVFWQFHLCLSLRGQNKFNELLTETKLNVHWMHVGSALYVVKSSFLLSGSFIIVAIFPQEVIFAFLFSGSHY